MSRTLASSYPSGEYLEGNFITYYCDNYQYFDRYIVKLFGERGIEVDDTESLEDTIINWGYDVNAIVFSHILDWAKMYSASIKDYEPLWNVDGTVTTTYGATRDTDSFGNTREQDAYGATQDTMQYGATSESMQYGATSESTQYGATSESMQYGATSESTQYGGTSETLGQHTNTGTDYKTSYPDSTEVKTDKHTDELGAQTNTTVAHTDTTTGTQHTDTKTGTTHTDTTTGTTHTDTHTGTTHSDTASSLAHTDTHTGDAHTDTHSSDQHIDTERRTGNIGVTKSTELVESEYKLRYNWNFFRLIFGYIVREMGAIYYDWYRY